MAYSKQNFETGQTLTADMLNHIEAGFDNVQDKLVSGTNIKSIDGKSILGSGNITISAGTVKSVNGKLPDTNGDVSIVTYEPTDDQVSDAVNAYLALNPVEPYDDTEINDKIIAVKDTIDDFLVSSNILISFKDKLIKGYKWDLMKDFTSGSVAVTATRCVLDTIELKDATSIKIEVIGDTWKHVYAFFDSNGNLLASNITGSAGLIWTTDTIDYIGNVKYVRMMFAKNNNSTVTDNDFDSINREIIVTINNQLILNTKSDIESAIGSILQNTYKNTVRVMSYNVGGWAFGVGGSNPGLTDDTYAEKLLNYKNYFASVTPDICFMQEKQSIINKTSGDKANDVLMGPLYPYIFENLNSLSTQSIYPLQSSEVITLTAGTRPQLRSYIKIGDKKVCILCCHLTSGVDAYADIRAAQIVEVLDLVKDEEYVIMAGDFNVQHLSEYDSFINAGYKIVNGGYFPEQATAYGGIKPHDNIIVSSNINIRNFHLDADQYDKLASDHLPIWSDLVLV